MASSAFPCRSRRRPYCWSLLPLAFLLLTMSPSVAARQRFRERPQSVEVAEGSDVVLRCQVEDQQGRAQWTKDGFALGFDRGVPGYPRFSYLGSESLGQHHLFITGVTTTEAGEYQCQVGPGGPANPAIWATANITVLVPPRSVVVEGRSEGERVVVEEGGSLALQCVAGDARPPSTLTWLADGVPLTSGVMDERHRVEGSGRGRGWSVRSELEVRVGAQDDGRRYTCEATHPALNNNVPLTASVTLAVLHAPSPPRISGYRAGQVVTAGQEVRLTCRATGGFPRPVLTWSRRPSPLSPTAITTAAATTTTTSISSSFTAASTLRFIATTEDDGAEYVCSAVNDLLQQPLSTAVTLIVYYPPGEVHIRGPRRVGEGRSLNLTCDTAQSNPPAILQWKIQGERVRGRGETRHRVEGSGGWVTTSHVTWHGVRSRQVTEVTVECRAINPAVERSVTKTVTIIVTKPAGAPRFETDLSGEYLAGSTLDLTCTSVGGHPPPSLRLYKGKEQLPTEVWQEGRVRWGRVRLGLTAADNGAAVSCRVSADDHHDDNATASSSSSSQVLTTTATLLVKYPPWEVTGWVSPAKVEAGSVVRLTCLSSPSRPPAALTWHAPSTLALPPPSTTPQVGMGGPGTRSEVRVRVGSEHDGVVVECSSTNGLAQPVSTLLTLHVLHGPVWTRSPPPQVNVSEGGTLVVNAEATANPGPPRYQWRRGEVDVGGSGGELRLVGVGRAEGGRYTVSAHTDLGTAHAAFMVSVQYGPEHVEVRREVEEAERGAVVEVECRALGNPMPLVTWTRAPPDYHTRTSGEPDGLEMRERVGGGMGVLGHDVGVLGRGEGVARLRVEAATWADTGVYLCHAHNPLGSSPPTPLRLVVQQAVRVVVGEGVIWAALGERGRLVCRVRAAPPPTFVWSSVGGLILLNSDKYTIHEPKLVDGLVTWMSVLEVTDLRPQDYTLYRCTATNALGSHALTLYLRQPGPPFPPHDFTVVNVTAEAAWVSWVANLEGGVPSKYSLRFRAHGGTAYKYVEVSGRARGARVGPLVAGKQYVVGLAARNSHGASQYVTATLPPKTAARSPPTPATTLRGPVEEEWGGRLGGGGGGGGGGGEQTPPHHHHLSHLHLVLAAAALLFVVLAATACVAHCRGRHKAAKTASAGSSVGTTSLATLGVSLSSSPAHHQQHHQQQQQQAPGSPEDSITTSPAAPPVVIVTHADVLPMTEPEPTTCCQEDSAKMPSPPPSTTTTTISAFSSPPPPPPPFTTTTCSSTTLPSALYPAEPDVCSVGSGVEVKESQRWMGGQGGSLRPVVLLRSADSQQQQQLQPPQLVQDTLRSLPLQQQQEQQEDTLSSSQQHQNILSSLPLLPPPSPPHQQSIPLSSPPCQEQTSLSSLSQQLYALSPQPQSQQTGLSLVPEQQTSFISLPPPRETASPVSIPQQQQQVIVTSLIQPQTILTSLQQPQQQHQSVSSRISSPQHQLPDTPAAAAAAAAARVSEEGAGRGVTDYDVIPIPVSSSQSPQHQHQQPESSYLYLQQQQRQSGPHLYLHQGIPTQHLLQQQHLHLHRQQQPQETQHSPQHHTGASLCPSPQHGSSMHQLAQHEFAQHHSVYILSPQRHSSRARLPTFSTFRASPTQQQQESTVEQQHSPLQQHSRSPQHQLPQHTQRLIHCHSPPLQSGPQHPRHSSPQLKQRKTQQGYERDQQQPHGSPNHQSQSSFPLHKTSIGEQSTQPPPPPPLPQQGTAISQPSPSPVNKDSTLQGSSQQ